MESNTKIQDSATLDDLLTRWRKHSGNKNQYSNTDSQAGSKNGSENSSNNTPASEVSQNTQVENPEHLNTSDTVSEKKVLNLIGKPNGNSNTASLDSSQVLNEIRKNVIKLVVSLANLGRRLISREGTKAISDRLLNAKQFSTIVSYLLKILPVSISRCLSAGIHLSLIVGAIYLTISHDTSALFKTFASIDFNKAGTISSTRVSSTSENQSVHSNDNHNPVVKDLSQETKSIEHKEEKLSNFTKDFIADKIDPTRGLGELLKHDSTGIDISYYQGNINWVEISKNLVNFVFIKATQGTKFVDPKYMVNTKGARDQGILQGSYHFYDPRKSGQEQAEFFLEKIKYIKGDLPPVLDIEITHGVESEKLIIELKHWLEIVENKINCKPIIYTYHPFWIAHLKGHFSKYYFWLADYNSEKTLPFKTPSWRFWQHSDKGKVKGLNGALVDLNRFYSSTGANDLCDGVSDVKDG